MSDTAALDMVSWLVLFTLPVAVEMEYAPVPAMDCKVPLLSCLYHIILGVGTPVAVQVRVTDDSLLTDVSTGDCVMDTATVKQWSQHRKTNRQIDRHRIEGTGLVCPAMAGPLF